MYWKYLKSANCFLSCRPAVLLKRSTSSSSGTLWSSRSSESLAPAIHNTPSVFMQGFGKGRRAQRICTAHQLQAAEHWCLFSCTHMKPCQNWRSYNSWTDHVTEDHWWDGITLPSQDSHCLHGELEWECQNLWLTSFTNATSIMAPKTPSLTLSGWCCSPKIVRNRSYAAFACQGHQLLTRNDQQSCG